MVQATNFERNSILMKRDYPGYLYMVDNDATTTWEHWNLKNKKLDLQLTIPANSKGLFICPTGAKSGSVNGSQIRNIQQIELENEIHEITLTME